MPEPAVPIAVDVNDEEDEEDVDEVIETAICVVIGVSGCIEAGAAVWV
jgi:hypothetical protein